MSPDPGFSTPSEAITQLGRAWDLHALDVESLGRLIISIRPECWRVNIGSGMLYGRSSLSGKLQTEGRMLAPSDQYCVTKTARDIAQGALANEGLRCLRVRPIHHTGPGQREKFVIPPFAVQIARMAEFEVQPVVDVVNSDAQRDSLMSETFQMHMANWPLILIISYLDLCEMYVQDVGLL